MSRIQSVIRVCVLAMPLLLLAQCTPESSPQGTLTSLQKSPCLDNPDPARTFEVLAPQAGPVCTGWCTRILLDVQNPCGQFTTNVEGWYDGVYRHVGSVANGSAIHWDSPLGKHALASASREVRLRVTVTDELGLIGTRDLVFQVIALQPGPAPRPPVERD